MQIRIIRNFFLHSTDIQVMLSDHPNPNRNYTKIQNFESGLMAQIENSKPWKLFCV